MFDDKETCEWIESWSPHDRDMEEKELLPSILGKKNLIQTSAAPPTTEFNKEMDICAPLTRAHVLHLVSLHPEWDG